MQKFINGIAAAFMVLLLPLSAGAQEAEAPAAEASETCTATIAPIHAGEAVAVKATFAEPFGQIVAIEAPAESGLALVTEDAAKGEMVEMADEAETEGEAKAEAVAEAENASVFWLDATEATPGTYEITLKNEAGASCAAEISVTEVEKDEEKAENAKDGGEEY